MHFLNGEEGGENQERPTQLARQTSHELDWNLCKVTAVQQVAYVMQTQITLLDFPSSSFNTWSNWSYVMSMQDVMNKTVSHCLQEKLERFLSYFLNCLGYNYIQNKQHVMMAQVIISNTGYAIKSACIWQSGLTCYCLAKKSRIRLFSKCLLIPVNQTVFYCQIFTSRQWSASTF